MASFEFRGKQVEISAAPPCDVRAALGTDLFQNWLSSLDPSLDLQSVQVQSIDRFGPTRIGFLKFHSRILRNGVPIPGIVVLRGQAVALLLVITDTDTGEEWTILTEQPRVPTGHLLRELPAGMTDGSGNLKGVAIKELEEECGLVARAEDLLDLVDLAFEGTQPGIYMSPGLLDESVRLFLWKTTMPHAKVVELEGKLRGESEHEQIQLRIVKLADLWRTAPDAKALSSLALYQALKAQGKA
jgi:ADP-sugar diphosphatase